MVLADLPQCKSEKFVPILEGIMANLPAKDYDAAKTKYLEK
jgi:hypothetical protein